MKAEKKEENNHQNKKEDMAFRYLYGFGILFVVLSHCDGGGIQFLSNWMNFGAFHLAIFVFGSGYFFKEEKLKQPLLYLWQKIKKLLIPLWCWNLFYGILLALLKLCGFTFGEALTLKNVLLFPISSEQLYVLNMGSWFIFPFFMVQLLYAVLKLLLDYLKKPQITDRLIQIIFIAAGGVGVYLAGHGYHEVNLYPVFRILYFMPFYVLGMLYRDFLEKHFQKLPAFMVLGVCLFISLLLNTHFGRTVYAIPSSCDYPFGVAATYLAALLGILFWLKVSQLFAGGNVMCKPLLTMGRSTWEIMIHQFAGIMAVKCFFAGANRLFGCFPDFDRNAFLGDIWYLYRPCGIEEYAFLYVLGAITMPLVIKWLLTNMKTGICNGSGKKMAEKSDETAVLVGAAPLGAESEYIERCIGDEQVYTIAVDGGIRFFYERNILPDFWVGDMDSVSAVVREEMIEKMPPQCFCQVPVMKDDTDMALAVKKAWERGIRDILMFGAMGGERSSHSFANVQLMLHYAKKGCRIQSISANMRMEVLYHGEKKFEADEKGLVSVFALTGCAKGVLLKGLKYEYCGDLTNDVALGVSNAFIGREGCIAVEDGGLLLIYEEEG